MNKLRFRVVAHWTHNLLDHMDIRPISEHLDLFQPIYIAFGMSKPIILDMVSC